MTVAETLSMKKFPVVVDSRSPAMERIYPLKQREVSDIINAASGFKEIKRIYIFGSATTVACTVDSDLDICLDADVSDGMKIYEIQRVIGEICDWNCDIIMYCHIGDRLRRTVEEEGVVIYE